MSIRSSHAVKTKDSSLPRAASPKIASHVASAKKALRVGEDMAKAARFRRLRVMRKRCGSLWNKKSGKGMAKGPPPQVVQNWKVDFLNACHRAKTSEQMTAEKVL